METSNDHDEDSDVGINTTIHLVSTLGVIIFGLHTASHRKSFLSLVRGLISWTDSRRMGNGGILLKQNNVTASETW